MNCLPGDRPAWSIHQQQEALSNNFIVIFSKVSDGFENKHQDFRRLHEKR
jgi:hypothetical protein